MFYFKVTVRSKVGPKRVSKNLYRECLSHRDLGELVADKMARPGTTSVSVTGINQAHYLRETGAA